METCSIEGCTKPHRARGWCDAHWKRWRRNGDPLGGLTVQGDPERYLHEVVLTYDGNDCLTWPYGKSRGGYGVLHRDGTNKYVHRLACEAVNGPPPTPEHQAAHSCGRGHLACCTRRHLSWKTRAENMADKLVHDTHQRGERHGSSKLTEADVREIRALLGRLSQGKIAKRFGINRSTVSRIHRGQNWLWQRGELARPSTSKELD